MKRKIFKFAALTMMLTAPCFVSVSFAQMLPPGINLYVSGPDALEVGQWTSYYAEGAYNLPYNIKFNGWDIRPWGSSYTSNNLGARLDIAFYDPGSYTVGAMFRDSITNRMFYADKTVEVVPPLEFYYPYINERKLNNNGLTEYFVPDIPGIWLDNCSVRWYVGGHGYLYSDYYVPLTGTFPAGLQINCIFYWGSRESQMASTWVW